MWTKPWTLKEGSLICAGLLMAGLMLEMSVGPVVWAAFAWPVNILALATLLVAIAAIHLLRHQVYAFRFIGSYRAAVPALCTAVALTMVMGLTRQQVNGRWIYDMLSFWPFVLVFVYIDVMLGVTVLRRLSAFSWRRDIPFLLNHLGLFVALTSATLGNADMQRVKMITATGEVEWRAVNTEGTVVELPIAIELQRFIMEEFAAEDEGVEQTDTSSVSLPQRTPKRFASEVMVYTESGKKFHATIDVNKPLSVDGWKIYQYGYDTAMGAMSNISILELVRDPWLPAVYTGIWMMLAGAVVMFVTGVRRKKS